MSGLMDMMRDDGGPSLGEAYAAFDAARVSRRDAGFLPIGLGPNAEAEQFGGLERIWARSTHLHDNNELVDNAAEADIDRVIGTGIDDLEPDTGWADVDDQIAALYEWAFEAADMERSMSIADIQALYWRERRRTGECGVRVVMAEPFDGYPFMPAVELIEAERIPMELSGINPETGLAVRQGVEYDKLWRVVAYHVLTAHPRDGDPRFGMFSLGVGFGGASFGAPGLVRVPATEMRLRMRNRRIRQLRGVPDLVSAMRTIRTEDEYVDVQMTHARTAASIGVIMETTNASMFTGRSGAEPILFDQMGRPVTSFAGGGIAFKRPGTSAPEVIHANLPGPQYESTVRGLQRRVSRGLNGPYSAISGDYSQETFASNRANRIDQRQRDLRNQVLGIWRPLMRPYLRVLVQWGLLTGRVKLDESMVAGLKLNPERLYRTSVPQPGDAYVNPSQESSATETDIRTGVRSPIECIGTRGGSWKRTARQSAKFEAFVVAERLKLGLPAYPPTSSGGGGGKGGGSGGGSGGGDEQGDTDKPRTDRDDEADEELDGAASEIAAMAARSGVDVGRLARRLVAISGCDSEDGGINDLVTDRARRNGTGVHA